MNAGLANLMADLVADLSVDKNSKKSLYSK